MRNNNSDPTAVPEDRRRKRPMAAFAFTAVACLAAVGSASLVYQASSAAFTASTENHTDSFTAGALALSDNDSNAAMFTVAGLVPGSSGSSCITVTYTGTVVPSAPVQVYVAAGDATDTAGSGGGGTSAYLNFSLETATGSGIFGSGAACTGLTGTTIFGNTADTVVTAGRMLSDFVAKNTYSTGGTTSVSSGWTPSSGASTTKVFRFNYKMATDTPNSAMGALAVVKITWEARS
jgi:hypothetical protein